MKCVIESPDHFEPEERVRRLMLRAETFTEERFLSVLYESLDKSVGELTLTVGEVSVTVKFCRRKGRRKCD